MLPFLFFRLLVLVLVLVLVVEILICPSPGKTSWRSPVCRSIVTPNLYCFLGSVRMLFFENEYEYAYEYEMEGIGGSIQIPTMVPLRSTTG